MKKAIYFFAAVVLAASMSSCRTAKTITVEVPVPVHDTTYQTLLQHDSVYVDKWHEVVVKGDTVYDTRVETVYREKTITDTIYQVQEVPVTITETVVKEVKKPLGWWQKLFIGLGVLSLLAAAGLAAWKLLRKR